MVLLLSVTASAKSAVFSCEQTREGTRRKFKQVVKVMGKQELFSMTDISRCLNLIEGRNQKEKTGETVLTYKLTMKDQV